MTPGDPPMLRSWRCEDGHVTTCEKEPRACTQTALGYTMRLSDALVVPPACNKPLRPYLAGIVRLPSPIGGLPRVQLVYEDHDCLICGKPSGKQRYCDDCWSDKQGGYVDG